MPSPVRPLLAGRPSTRRALLRSLAVTPFAASLTSLTTRASASVAESFAESSPVRVATQNLGLGVSLYPLFVADTERERRRLVGEMYESVRASDVPGRMAAIAAEFDAVDADVIAVQEAASIAAEGDEIDFLAELSAALDARDSGYRVAISSENTDAALPAEIDGDEATVRLRDRDALLVAEDVSVDDTSETTFDSALDVSFSESESFRLARGFAAATVSLPDAPAFDVLSTHLERASGAIRGAQADELVSWVRERSGPVVVAGDVNDEPGTGAYATLSEVLVPATDGIDETCCRASDLSGGEFSEAIDHVFSRGLTPLSAERFTLSSTRVETDRGDLWPSDHAGVVASLEASETTATDTTTTERPTTGTTDSVSNSTAESPTQTATEDATTTVDSPDSSATTTDSTQTGTETPGFGFAAALVALAAAAERMRRSD
ncbi:endonuclease/exonuclease/phosphatase family protein [Haloferax namakaokahaiae]|uniref:Endonuclease/exonuclease/phosphatase family protein n=1 Tax=Haloferax namakaokahaiae TaxID=1748331 RepID=A0ABD5ZHG7_9EURY